MKTEYNERTPLPDETIFHLFSKTFHEDLVRRNALHLLLEKARSGMYEPLEIHDEGDVYKNFRAYHEFKKLKKTTPDFYIKFITDTHRKLTQRGSNFNPIHTLSMLGDAFDSLQELIMSSDSYCKKNPNLNYIIDDIETEIEKIKEANKKIRSPFVI